MHEQNHHIVTAWKTEIGICTKTWWLSEKGDSQKHSKQWTNDSERRNLYAYRIKRRKAPPIFCLCIFFSLKYVSHKTYKMGKWNICSTANNFPFEFVDISHATGVYCILQLGCIFDVNLYMLYIYNVVHI